MIEVKMTTVEAPDDWAANLSEIDACPDRLEQLRTRLVFASPPIGEGTEDACTEGCNI